MTTDLIMIPLTAEELIKCPLPYELINIILLFNISC